MQLTDTQVTNMCFYTHIMKEARLSLFFCNIQNIISFPLGGGVRRTKLSGPHRASANDLNKLSSFLFCLLLLKSFFFFVGKRKPQRLTISKGSFYRGGGEVKVHCKHKREDIIRFFLK
jgi:hypothetical protein